MADGDYDLIWKETMSQIQEELGEQEFAMWFNLEYLSASENELTIGVPSLFYLDQVKTRYQLYIESKIRELIGKNISIIFIIKTRIKEDPILPPAEGKSIQEVAPARGTSLQVAPKPIQGAVMAHKKRHPQLREDYTFDKYVIGDDNSFAANAAQAIAKNPGTAYNPCLIYGSVGLGKTHLMQAIGNYIHESTDNKIIYITAEGFMNEFIQYLKEGKMPAFKNKYRYVDVLLIDDIHTLAKGNQTQEELFHTFNALYNDKKQIVFTCDRPVSELKNLTDRLKSRFSQGLNVDLQPPNYETRCAILKKKIESQGISIPDEVITFVSTNISTNVRDLEGALNKLIAYAVLGKKTLTLEIAQQQLKDIIHSSKTGQMSIDIIQQVIAEHYHLSQNDLKGRKKTQNIVTPRQLAMYITRELTENSTTEIGQSFGGRDHTTVMHSCQKIEEKIRSDPQTESLIQTLIRLIKDSSVKS